MIRAMMHTVRPGPKLPAVIQTALAAAGSTKVLHFCQRRYGDRFTVRMIGMGTVVYLADPADIRTVLRGDPDVFHAGAANAPLAAILGSESVLVTDDEAHQRSRALMLPAFHGESVRRQVDEMSPPPPTRWRAGRAASRSRCCRALRRSPWR